MKTYHVVGTESPRSQAWGWLGTTLWEPKCSSYQNQKTHLGNGWHLFMKSWERWCYKNQSRSNWGLKEDCSKMITPLRTSVKSSIGSVTAHPINGTGEEWRELQESRGETRHATTENLTFKVQGRLQKLNWEVEGKSAQGGNSFPRLLKSLVWRGKELMAFLPRKMPSLSKEMPPSCTEEGKQGAVKEAQQMSLLSGFSSETRAIGIIPPNQKQRIPGICPAKLVLQSAGGRRTQRCPTPEGIIYCSHPLLTNFTSKMTSKQQWSLNANCQR